MDTGVLLAVIVFVSCVGKSQYYSARKCHSKTLPLSAAGSCPSDFINATCSEGLISIKEVKYTDDNCNLLCGNTCCIKTDMDASDTIKRKLIQECNYTKSCILTSITSGSVYVEYTCTDAPTKSTSTYPSTTLGGNVSAVSTSMSDNTTDAELTAVSVTDSQIDASTSGNKETQKSTDKQKRNQEIRTEILAAVIVIIVLCLASTVVAMILCRMLRARKQQPQTDIYEMADQSEISPESSHANAEDGMQMTPPSDQSLDREAPIHDTQTENEYDTPTEMPDNTKAPTTATCSDIEYEDVDNGLIQQADKRELIDENADTNNVNMYNRVQHKGNKGFIYPTGEFYDTTREAVREAQTILDNEYDHADHSKREYVEKQNGDEAYDAENEYDDCETSGTEATTLLDGTYDVMATN